MLRNGGDGYTAQTWLVNANPGLGWQGAYNQVGLAAEYFCPSSTTSSTPRRAIDRPQND